MVESRLNKIIDCLAVDYINSINDHFERSKVRMILWTAVLFGIFLLLSVTTFLSIPPLIFLIYISFTNNYQFWGSPYHESKRIKPNNHLVYCINNGK